ncbi:hypothetical protein ID866_4227 [Astraeus odoratus]|nr:hypothetical protein ID866_4227 [Astraeus odoratus]
MLVMCGLLVGTGGSAGGGSGINVTAKSFPDFARATATSMVVSGIGLSAFFYSSIAQTFFPGDTSALLLLLSLGTSMPILVAMLVMRPVPFPSIYLNQTTNECEDYEPTGSRVDVNLTAQAAVSFIDTSETNSHTPLLGNQPAIGVRELFSTIHMSVTEPEPFKGRDFTRRAWDPAL